MGLRRLISAIPWWGVCAPRYRGTHFSGNTVSISHRPLVAVLPGSRRGESARHLPALLDAVGRLGREQALNFVLPASATTGAEFFRDRIGKAPIRVIEGESWDAMAHASVALAASGTVTVEAALLGAPMVTFYKVTAPSWLLGKNARRRAFLFDGQSDCRPRRCAGADARTNDRRPYRRRSQPPARGWTSAPRKCRPGWRKYAKSCRASGDAPSRAAAIIQEILEGQAAHVS